VAHTCNAIGRKGSPRLTTNLPEHIANHSDGTDFTDAAVVASVQAHRSAQIGHVTGVWGLGQPT